MKFPENNTITYFQDHHFYVGIPSDVDFEIAITLNGLVTLTAPGYGVVGDYGNGSILLKFSSLKGFMLDAKTTVGELAYQAIKAQFKAEVYSILEDL